MKKIVFILVMMFTVSTATGCTGFFPSASADALNAVVSFAEGQQKPESLQLATVSPGLHLNLLGANNKNTNYYVW